MRLLDRLLGRFRRSHGQTRPAARKQAPPLAVEQPETRNVMDAAANALFVSKAFIDLLNRPADPVGLVSFTSRLNAGVDATRASIALAIQGSLEGRAVEVETAYLKFLHRPADPGALNNFTAFLSKGG